MPTPLRPPAALAGLLIMTGTAAAQPAEKVDFNRDVRPILSNNCYTCHGPDEKERKGDLRLDTHAGAVASAVVPGKPADSELVRRLTADGGERMPPRKSGKTLTPREVDILTRWVAQGGEYATHWAYVKPVRPAVPAVADAKVAARVRNPIDAFVFDRLAREGLTPSPEADKYTLIRRVTLDLTGLPPTPAEADAFAQDPAPDAYEKLVDKLLARPAYGEHLARGWLDLARYADSAGYADDPGRTIWKYRDYVVNSFNANKPFDRFTVEQLAGDLLPKPTDEQLTATAFHRNTMTNNEGGTNDEEFRNVAVVDRVNTTFTVWMGTSAACCQCHTHKYDPLTQKEYFGLFAFFNTTADADRSDESPTLGFYSGDAAEKRKRLDADIAKYEAAKDEERLKAVRKQLADLKPETTVPVMREQPAGQKRKTRLQYRGNFLDLGDEVAAGTPAVFPPLSKDAPRDRLGLARWLVSSDNPLTARVVANRYWEQVFGVGLVRTSEEFGTQGEPPSHPELLDWLACELTQTPPPNPLPAAERGDKADPSSSPFPLRGGGRGEGSARSWDVKRFLKLLVTSAAYRQSAKVTPALHDRDPENRLLARGPRVRLTAEMVRDQALAAAGLLSAKMGGPPVRPFQPNLGVTAAFGGAIDWTPSTGEDKYRRGIYTSWRRSNPYPSMAAFDAPNRDTCVVRRGRTNSPLQALVTMNDPVYVEAAQGLARRVLKDGGKTPAERAAFALRACLTRPPTPAEVDRVVKLHADAKAGFAKEPAKAKTFATNPLGALPKDADVVDAAAWTAVANVLLNLDEMMMKR